MGTYGYARVSTADQDTAAQVAAFTAAGVAAGDSVAETVSGAVPAARRPLLASLLGRLGAGDVLAVAKLDRLGRDAADLLGVLADLDRRGVTVRLLDMGADTSTAAGRLVVAVLAAVAEWERGVMLERTKAGMAAARRAGRFPGTQASPDPVPERGGEADGCRGTERARHRQGARGREEHRRQGRRGTRWSVALRDWSRVTASRAWRWGPGRTAKPRPAWDTNLSDSE